MRPDFLLATVIILITLLGIYLSSAVQAQVVIIHEPSPNPVGDQTLGNP